MTKIRLIQTLSECLDRNYVASGVCILLLFFFHAFPAFRDNYHCSHTVHALLGPTTTLFRKKILKMGLTVLFTHLKIILLQCFQFLVSATISSIQTDPLSGRAQILPSLPLLSLWHKETY